MPQSAQLKDSALRIAYAGVHFASFYAFGDSQAITRKSALDALVKRMNCTPSSDLNLFSDAKGAEAAARSLAKEGADLVVLDVCTFPEGKAWMRFVELVDAPIAIWSRPEMKKTGPIGHNSFCGANFIVANMAKSGRRARRLFGEADSPEFQSHLLAAIELLSAAKKIKGSKIGLIGGGIVPKFHDLDISDTERGRLERQWGINFADIPFEEIWAIADKLPTSAIDTETKREAKLYRKIDVTAKALRDQAAMLLAIKSYAEKAGLAAMAIRCWPEFGANRSIWPCGLIGHLNDLGLPAACEGDPAGALDLLVASKLSKEPASILDITDFDDNDETLNLWHCGQGSVSCADSEGVELVHHMVDGKDSGGNPAKGHPSVHNMGYKPGPLTVFRTLGAFDDEFIIEGTLLKSSGHNTGTSGRLGTISYYGGKITNTALRELILSRGIPHHYAAFYKRAGK